VGGSAKSRVIDGADWANCRAMLFSCPTKLRCRGTGKRRGGTESWSFLGAPARLPFTRGGTFMTTSSELHVIRILALGILLILPATSGAQQRPPILEKLTKTYGLESFGQIEAIRYTFNVESSGRNVSRSWT